jgi:O-acetyl-ADP-ribose deacetylase (regulator of RNase III)
MKKTIRLTVGNVETSGAEAIVNAANRHLKTGRGVCGAIYAAAGVTELETYVADHFEGCRTGRAVVTPAFGISGSKYVLHAVGPIYSEYTPLEAARLLRKAYHSIFELCYSLGVKNVGVVAISSGIYGYPVEDVANIAADEAMRTPYKGDITFYVWQDNLAVFEKAFASILTPAVPVIVDKCAVCDLPADHIDHIGLPGMGIDHPFKSSLQPVAPVSDPVDASTRKVFTMDDPAVV